MGILIVGKPDILVLFFSPVSIVTFFNSWKISSRLLTIRKTKQKWGHVEQRSGKRVHTIELGNNEIKKKKI